MGQKQLVHGPLATGYLSVTCRPQPLYGIDICSSRFTIHGLDQDGRAVKEDRNEEGLFLPVFTSMVCHMFCRVLSNMTVISFFIFSR